MKCIVRMKLADDDCRFHRHYIGYIHFQDNHVQRFEASNLVDVDDNLQKMGIEPQYEAIPGNEQLLFEFKKNGMQ